MKKNLKQLLFEPVKHKPILDYQELYNRAKKILSIRQSGKLAYNLMELDRACDKFRHDTLNFFKALQVASQDSTDLYEASSSLWGELIHMRYHIREATSLVDKLGVKSRNMPPIDELTDYQLTKRFFAERKELHKKLFKAKKTAKSPKKKSKKASIKKKNTRKRRKK